jgi:hypothetical protein
LGSRDRCDRAKAARGSIGRAREQCFESNFYSRAVKARGWNFNRRFHVGMINGFSKVESELAVTLGR